MTSTQASKKSNEKAVISNIRDKREKQKPKDHLGQFVRSADKKKFLEK